MNESRAFHLRNCARLALVAALTLIAFGPSEANAQETTAPDIRDIRPVVMLLVDTSGSMERMPGGSWPPQPEPMCTGAPSPANERNRWIQLVEALTGTWADDDYYCTRVERTAGSFAGQPDENYYLAYHRPPLAMPQRTDGILDAYAERIKFGLMTFDATYTFNDTHPLLVTQSYFEGRLPDNESTPGGYSYGGPRVLTYPGCPEPFMIDSGARNARAPTGALISVGTEADDPRLINQQVQAQILNARPFGGTPTAAMLEDFRYYLANHPDVTDEDPYQGCRTRFALLLTDGQPDEDFRDARFNCEAVGGCPYERPAAVAADLCRYSGGEDGCTGVVDGVFVVAFDVDDPAAVAELDLIADAGGTGRALLASNRSELMERIAEALDRAAPGTTTRSRPAFATGSSTFATGVATQARLNSGFVVGGEGRPWSGVLERTRFECNAGLEAEPQPIEDRDRFHEILNTNDSRTLYTVATPDPADMTANLVGELAEAVPLGAGAPGRVVRGLRLSRFETTNLTPAHFGISSGDIDERRDRVVDWVHARSGSGREEMRLGDIYHSSPVTSSPPRVDIADEAFNLYRQQERVADRPTVVYVGTNDGILHAFAVEDFTTSGTGRVIRAGEELWGFVPPVIVPKLESATNSRQVTVDGTPVIRDVFFRRQPGDTPSEDLYHRVLVMGFRGGAPGYFALDITDPLEPVFLWQFVGEEDRTGGGRPEDRPTPLGFSYGRPAIGQVLVEVGGVLQERAVALLPGGTGVLDEDAARTTGPVGCPAQGVGQPPVNDGTTTARSRQRCWSTRGRILNWVDIVTGETIRVMNHTHFNAPMTGGVSLFPGETGTIAERAFMTDDDGVLWRVDFRSRNPADWVVEPFHDIFWDGEATMGQPAYEPPIITTDLEGQIVVIQATGDIDRLDGSAPNRVVSLTEVREFDAGGEPRFSGRLNWEVRLHAGEQVTGPLELFEGTVYFASFESGAGGSDACNVGRSRIWGVEYRETSADSPSDYIDVAGAFPAPRFESIAGSGTPDLHFRGPFENQLVLGVGITQQPTCIEGFEDFDPFLGSRYQVTNVGSGTFTLTAQVSAGDRSGAGVGAVASISETLPTPESFTNIQSWAGRVDR